MYASLVLTDPAASPGEGLLLRAVPLASDGRNEAWLRDFLLAHPSALPAAALDPAYADLIPVCRELRTPAGPLDALFVTRFGGLVVVECKLWRNPQARREVVGQILDYAKELATWDYADLQREVAIARRERGANALLDLVRDRYPEVDEAAFVDAVTRNLARGRMMLLLAGDGIREGTEAIVQYLGRHAGLAVTFGLVEMAGYAMPDGRLLVQPRLLARTVVVERAVIRIEGTGVAATVLAPEDTVPAAEPASDTSEDEDAEPASRRVFDAETKEADRRWRAEFVRRLRLDDPAQGTGRTGWGRVFLPLPVPWAWMTAYTARSTNGCGNILGLKGEQGRAVFDALEAERSAIEADLGAGFEGLAVEWRRSTDVCRLVTTRTFPGTWSPVMDTQQLDWLLGATNSFVNAVRPGVLHLLRSGLS